MAYRFCSSLSLGPASTGLTLKAQLLNSDGTSNGSEITTGFYEVGGGYYTWNYASVPDNFHGSVRYYTGTAPGTLRGAEAVNPSMAAPANWTALGINSDGVADSNVVEVNGEEYEAVTSVGVSEESVTAIAEATEALVSALKVVLAASQPDFTPAKAGDAMTLTSDYDAAKDAAQADALPANLDKLEIDGDGKYSATTLENAPGSDAGAIEIEAGVNLKQTLAVVLSALAGKVSGAGTGTIVFKGGNNDTTRITATTDAQGNRTSITLTLPS